jgi:hypothetical protein
LQPALQHFDDLLLLLSIFFSYSQSARQAFARRGRRDFASGFAGFATPRCVASFDVDPKLIAFF